MRIKKSYTIWSSLIVDQLEEALGKRKEGKEMVALQMQIWYLIITSCPHDLKEILTT